jgi:orotidine-5'-phosphate decarboxylase
MNRQELFREIQHKQSFLIVGLDTDINKIPPHLLQTEDPIFEFNKAIIEATQDYCVGYKPNLAFYEAMGIKGLESLQKTLAVIPKNCFTIADAKRGDIGNTADMYAKAFFNEMKFDSITVAPYMGKDSVTPFLQFKDKWAIVLALTSNSGSEDFQMIESNQHYLYETVVTKVSSWGTPDNTMFVVGATHPDKFAALRKLAPQHFFLVPGVGAQGGDLQSICQAGLNSECGLLVNASRSIIYASNGKDFAAEAAKAAITMQQEMKQILESNLLIS